MKVLVSGATGCVGRAVVHALRARGHKVVEGARSHADTAHSLHLDFAQPISPPQWAERLRVLQIEAVVNCVGILMPSRGQSFERVHTHGPIELFHGAALAGVRRVVQVSALGVGSDSQALAMPYLHSKLQADDALAGLGMEWAVLRPSLVYGPHSQSAALFATLASLPLISLPGQGRQIVQPLHVYELAEAIARLVEQRGPLRGVHELGGLQRITYREMLAHYRQAMGLGDALWLPLPMALMKSFAWFAQALPQKVFCLDTLRMLERGSAPAVNAMPALLGRAPAGMAQGLRTTEPTPLVDLRVQISPAVSAVLRASLAFMWIYTALISLLMPESSGVLKLLARCGLNGELGMVALWMTCALNLLLGALIVWRPSPWIYALQLAAIVGYTLTAAINMPELAIDHCGPLAKNLPVFGLVVVLWLARPNEKSRISSGLQKKLGSPDAIRVGGR